MENLKELQKQFQKRNFYTTKDSAKVYAYALFVPIALVFLFCYVVMMIAKNNGITAGEGENILTVLQNNYLWFGIILSMLSPLTMLSIYLIYNKSNRIKQSSCNISFKKANIWTALLSCLFGIIMFAGFVCLISGCFGKLYQIWGIQESELSLPMDNFGWLVLNLIIYAVMPAIVEEMIFRGVVFQGLKEKFSALASILLSGLLFAIFHGSVTQLVYQFVLGSIMAFVLHRTNNLLYPILIHFFNNTCSIVMMYLAKREIFVFNPKITWWFVIISILADALALVIGWLIDKYYLKPRQAKEIEKEGENIQAPALSVGNFPVLLLITAAVAIIMIVLNTVSSINAGG